MCTKMGTKMCTQASNTMHKRMSTYNAETGYYENLFVRIQKQHFWPSGWGFTMKDENDTPVFLNPETLTLPAYTIDPVVSEEDGECGERMSEEYIHNLRAAKLKARSRVIASCARAIVKFGVSNFTKRKTPFRFLCGGSSVLENDCDNV